MALTACLVIGALFTFGRFDETTSASNSTTGAAEDSFRRRDGSSAVTIGGASEQRPNSAELLAPGAEARGSSGSADDQEDASGVGESSGAGNGPGSAGRSESFGSFAGSADSSSNDNAADGSSAPANADLFGASSVAESEPSSAIAMDSVTGSDDGALVDPSTSGVLTPEEVSTPPRTVITSKSFGLDAVGTNIVYLIDVSEQVSGEEIDSGKAGVLKSLDALRAGQKFRVILFGSDYMPMFFPRTSEALPASRENLDRVKAWFESLDHQSEGDPAAVKALAYALREQPGTVFLVSGNDLTAEAVEEATRANAHRSIIHAIAVGPDGEFPAMQELAKRNGGEFLHSR